MASNLECIGLGVEDQDALAALVDAIRPSAVTIGEAKGVAVERWEDPSGARLILGIRRTEIVDLLPSFAATPGARLAQVEFVTDQVATASVVDDTGEQLTALAMEVEERRLIGRGPFPGPVLASVTGLGVDVVVHADAEAFEASPRSLVSASDQDEGGEPPEHYREQGWKWPPRMAAESFISYGVFGSPEQADPHARFAGTVTRAEKRTVVQTGQAFVAARVRTVGFELDLCMPFAGTEVKAGSIIEGTAFLVGSVAEPAVPPRRRWLRGRR